jgi:adenylate cyclase
MLATWAAVKPDIRLQHLACEAALDICEALVRPSQDQGHGMLATRVGLHAGRIAVGGLRIGTTQHHRSFGVIVNTSQRIQSLNKELRTRILASRDVMEGLSSFVVRPVGTFVFAGLTLPLDIYEVLGRRAQQSSAVSRGDLNWLSVEFTEALDAYKDGQWRAAIEQLVEILETYPEDGPAQFYLRKCEFYQRHPPPGIWDPVIRL